MFDLRCLCQPGSGRCVEKFHMNREGKISRKLPSYTLNYSAALPLRGLLSTSLIDERWALTSALLQLQK